MAVERNENFIHQVRFSLKNGKTFVSCNCRATVGKHEKAGKIFYEAIAPSKDLNQSREIYNNPENHWAPFTESDRARW